jgi:hypothetical protein
VQAFGIGPQGTIQGYTGLWLKVSANRVWRGNGGFLRRGKISTNQKLLIPLTRRPNAFRFIARSSCPCSSKISLPYAILLMIDPTVLDEGIRDNHARLGVDKGIVTY